MSEPANQLTLFLGLTTKTNQLCLGLKSGGLAKTW